MVENFRDYIIYKIHFKSVCVMCLEDKIKEASWWHAQHVCHVCASANIMEITWAIHYKCLFVLCAPTPRPLHRDTHDDMHVYPLPPHARVQEDLHAEPVIENCDAIQRQWHLKHDEYFNEVVKVRVKLGGQLQGISDGVHGKTASSRSLNNVQSMSKYFNSMSSVSQCYRNNPQEQNASIKVNHDLNIVSLKTKYSFQDEINVKIWARSFVSKTDQ